jgi:predicted amidohydrolase
MNSNTVTVSAIQYRPPKGDPDRARSEISQFAIQAASTGSKIIVFPEMATTGYVWKNPREITPFAESSKGKTYETLAFTAKRFGAWIICGYPEIENGTLYNSALIISPAGDMCANYRKCLLFETDTTWATPGDTRISIVSDYGIIAPGICMDLNDDEYIAFLHLSNTRIIPFCTNWLEEGLDVHSYWKTRLDSFKGFFIAANSWGNDSGISFCGQSAILGPGGTVLARADKEHNGIISAEIETVL